jgi:HD-GYP domain-containing protein (c-di-GMP phosphodiesterase class II)
MRMDVDPNLLDSILSLATVIEARDSYTGGHTWRVSRYAFELAKEAGLDADSRFIASVGGLAHDIGKIGVPDSILNKPGPLLDHEYAAMKAHPVIGRSVLDKHPLAPLLLFAVSEHHERLDGKGYPEGGRSGGLSIHGRIIAIADAFDAMTSTRPYRQGMPKGQALAVLVENAGSQFDSELAAAFAGLARRGALDRILGHANERQHMLHCEHCGPIIAPASDAAEGREVSCPHCTGIHVLRKAGEGLQAIFTGRMAGYYSPRADRDAVASVMATAREKVELGAA